MRTNPYEIPLVDKFIQSINQKHFVCVRNYLEYTFIQLFSIDNNIVTIAWQS